MSEIKPSIWDWLTVIEIASILIIAEALRLISCIITRQQYTSPRRRVAEAMDKEQA